MSGTGAKEASMKLADVVRDECGETDAQFPDKDAALRRAAELAVRHASLEGCVVETVYRALKEREGLGSTGFGNGIAIPHCRLAEASEFVAGLITVPQGVEFETSDGAPVRLIAFIVAPRRQTHYHIRLLSEISHVLRVPGAIDDIVQTSRPDETKQVFLNYGTRDLVGKSESRKLVQIIVVKETLFHELLKALAGVDSGEVAVLDVRTAEEHLAHMALFSGPWNGRHRHFCKAIIALVNENLVNETIRRLEEISGRLDEQVGVVVTVHDLFYAAGRLAL